MKRGELIILWVGGLLSVALLIPVVPSSDPSMRDVILRDLGLPMKDTQPSMAVVAGYVFNVVTKLLAIWIICGLVWLTLYRRNKRD
jgi:hypothetical protein